MRLFVGLGFPVRLSVLAFALLAFRPFDLMGYRDHRALLLTEGIVSRLIFGAAFHFLPELPAAVEHLTGRDLPGNGDCRIANVRALGPDGRLLIGLARNATGTTMPHVWGESVAGERVDRSCQTCRTMAIHAVLGISDRTINKVEVFNKDIPGLPQNIRYLKAALAVEKVRAALGLGGQA